MKKHEQVLNNAKKKADHRVFVENNFSYITINMIKYLN